MRTGRVILVRHGETAYNRKKGGAADSAERLRGWLDVPLNDEGKAQARAVASKLAGKGIDRVYSSDLVRAAETAKAIHALAGAPPLELTRDLRPWDVGRLAGQRVAEVLDDLEKLTRTPTKPAPGGESFDAFRKRFLGRLTALLAEAERRKLVLCAVSHTRNMQCARAWMSAGCRADLGIDMEAMNDYERELSTGEFLELEPRRCPQGETIARGASSGEGYAKAVR